MVLPKKEQPLNLKKEGYIEKPKFYFPSRKLPMDYYIDHDVLEIDDDYISSFYACRLSEREWGSNKFWVTFENCKNITIIDKYLSEKEFDRIKDIVEKWEYNNTLALREINIYIYEPELKDKKEEIIFSIKKLMNKNFIIYSSKDRDLLHDRFAILDDELFHFGGTVGGYQQGLTAYSCGWSNRKIYKILETFKKNKFIYEVKKYD